MVLENVQLIANFSSIHDLELHVFCPPTSEPGVYICCTAIKCGNLKFGDS